MLDPVVEVKVMVVALGPHGHEVSRSRIVAVTTGGDVTGEVPADPDPPPDDGGGWPVALARRSARADAPAGPAV